MNSFGQLFRISLFGESHGNGIGVVIDGCPSGVPINKLEFIEDLARRKANKKGNTPRKEADNPIIKSGIFNQRTTGSPIAIFFSNKNIRPSDYHLFSTIPRPGHADFVGFHKHGGFNDSRGGGYFSGRLTLALVTAGVLAKKLIKPAEINANILEIGGSKDFDSIIDTAIKEGDSIGGIIECSIKGLPVGLGEPFFDSVESLISHLVFAIPGTKGIEFGSGFACSKMRGSEYNDIMVDKKGTTLTNHGGGINGGITNGNEVIFRVAVRPTSSIAKKQDAINLITGQKETLTITGRHDTCFAMRMPVIIEAAVAIVFADLLMRAGIIPRVWREKQGKK